jgi:hypothetical protein
MNLQNLKNNKIYQFLKVFDTVEFLGLILIFLPILFCNFYFYGNDKEYLKFQSFLIIFTPLVLLITFYNIFINRTIFTFISKFIVFKEHLNYDKIIRILVVDFCYFLTAVLTFFIFTMVIGDYFYESIGVTDKYLTFGIIYLLLIIMSLIGERKYFRQMYKDLNGKYPNNKKRKNNHSYNVILNIYTIIT